MADNFARILRWLPKPLRRRIGRLWSDWDRAKAESAFGDAGPYCHICGQFLEWMPYEKVLECPTVIQFRKQGRGR